MILPETNTRSTGPKFPLIRKILWSCFKINFELFGIDEITFLSFDMT